ncbi:MAG: hypothetical protein HY313_10125 [Acidobacteria bacterium]|nr:hypothetical protein [Acidobacteriota bacterium]
MATPSLQRAPVQVVIAFLNGRRIRGYLFDFSPTCDRCKVYPSPTPETNVGEIVDLKTLKAIFFLQEAMGESGTNASSAGQDRKIEVIFSDGERLEGTTQDYSQDQLGFFMVPEDPTRKIMRVFVINANMKNVRWL